MRRYLIIIFALAAVALSGCKHMPTDFVPDPQGPDTPPGPPVVTNNCDPDTVYFVNDILPLIISNCAMSGCHDAASAEDGVILTDYASIINTGDVRPGNPGGSDLYEAITDSDPEDRMPQPPNPPLTSEQINMIRTWINQGAQNNSCISGCDTTDVTFSGTVKPIIAAYCQGCHSGPSPSAGIALTTYSEIADIADDGRLIGTTRWLSGYPQMPDNGDQLSECQIRAFELWIADGTPDN